MAACWRPARHQSQSAALTGAAGLLCRRHVALFPVTPGGLGIVKASVSGLLMLSYQ
jgi:hypothetical protein